MDSYMRDIIDYAERMTRARISEWPDGSYSFRDHIDDDGLSDAPIPIAVTLDVAGDHVTLDFAGSSPQLTAAINTTLPYTHSYPYLSVCFSPPGHVPNNEHEFPCLILPIP